MSHSRPKTPQKVLNEGGSISVASFDEIKASKPFKVKKDRSAKRQSHKSKGQQSKDQTTRSLDEKKSLPLEQAIVVEASRSTLTALTDLRQQTELLQIELGRLQQVPDSKKLDEYLRETQAESSGLDGLQRLPVYEELFEDESLKEQIRQSRQDRETLQDEIDFFEQARLQEEEKLPGKQLALLHEFQTKQTNLAKLKSALAEALLKVFETIRKELYAEGFRYTELQKIEQQRKDFNEQFKGFVRFSYDEGLVYSSNYLSEDSTRSGHFSQLSLEETQVQVMTLLRMANQAYFSKAANLVKLLRGLAILNGDTTYKKRVGSEYEHKEGGPFRVISDQFFWSRPALDLQAAVNGKCLGSQAAQLRKKYFDDTGAELGKLKERMIKTQASFHLCLDRNKKLQKRLRLIKKAERVGKTFLEARITERNAELAKIQLQRQAGRNLKARLDVEFSDKPALDPQKGERLYFSSQLDLLVENVNQLKLQYEAYQKKSSLGSDEQEAARVGLDTLAVLSKDLLAQNAEEYKGQEGRPVLRRLQLRVKAAGALYQLQDVSHKLTRAYLWDLPLELEGKLTCAMTQQDTLLRALVHSPEQKSVRVIETPEEKCVAELNQTLTTIPADDLLRSQFCRLLISTLRNHHYWQEQLLLPSLRQPGQLPAGIREMNAIIDDFNRSSHQTEIADWVADPAWAKTFLSRLQEEARNRLTYKFCCFFSPIRNASLRELYHCLAKLDPNEITTLKFDEVQFLDSTVNTLNTLNNSCGK